MSATPFVSDQPAVKVHSSLRRSLKALEKAQQCSVLWFAEVMNRQLYRELGYSSINQYARKSLGFSKTRTGVSSGWRGAWKNCPPFERR